MTYQLKRIVSVLCLAAALGAATFLPASGHAETLRFVFMADSRGSSTSELIRTAALNAINTKILALSPRPSFVLFGGDQSYRSYLNGTYNFQAWKGVMKPLTDAGITLYTAIGNHELYDESGSKFLLGNQTEYQKDFPENPANGPSGYKQLVYSFASPGGDAFFAVLDPYYLTADVDSPNTTGTVDDTQLKWLTSQIAQTKATHKFLFTHGPYYYVVTPDFPVNTTYTKLWSILDQNRFDIYFCGHTHLYSRKTMDSSMAPSPQLSPPVQWKNKVVQVISAPCGADVNTSPLTVDRTTWHIFDASTINHFSVVDINGSTVKVTSYSGGTGDYTIIDSFTINHGFSAGTYLLLY